MLELIIVFVVVGVALILFYKLFFGSADEKRGCGTAVYVAFVVFAIVFLTNGQGCNCNRTTQMPVVQQEKYFGITSSWATPETCWAYGVVDNGMNLYVDSVALGSPAAAAGLKAGDLIVAVDGYAPDSPELRSAKNRHEIGEYIPFRIVTSNRVWWDYHIRLGAR